MTIGEALANLQKSNFRSRFHLSAKDKAYIAEKGLPVIREHAADFVRQRLAPAQIPNDGKQTPMRYLWPNTPVPAAAEGVWKNGIKFPAVSN